jgi:hypothetical protein
MIRMVISLDEEDKLWLDRKASADGISMAEVVRKAVKRMRSEERDVQVFNKLLQATIATGSGEDGLAVQRRLRDEWRRRAS